jgi:hypothetical protein
MDDIKSFFKSKTILGIAVSAAGKILSAIFGVTIDSDTEAQLLSLVSLAISFGGDALAVYGRIKATKRLG